MKGKELIIFLVNAPGNDKVTKAEFEKVHHEYYQDETITKEDIFEVLYEHYKDNEEAIRYLKFNEEQKDKLSLHDVKGLITGMYLYTM